MVVRNLTLLRSGERGSCGAIWRWLCLSRSSDIEEHSAAATTSTDLGVSTLLVTFLGLSIVIRNG